MPFNRIYGIHGDKKLSSYLKAWISQPDADGKINTLVCGLIGPGTTRSLQANWTSPFEQNNVGGLFESGANVIQTASEGRTAITTFSSTQVWDGNRPTSFQLNLIFYAVGNAADEVTNAIRALEMMMGPDISAGSKDDGSLKSIFKNLKPGGRIPAPVILNIGRRMYIDNCVIENMSVPLDGPRTASGDLVRADVNLSIATKTMLNKDNIGNTYR
jgi:hypothetical protein